MIILHKHSFPIRFCTLQGTNHSSHKYDFEYPTVYFHDMAGILDYIVNPSAAAPFVWITKDFAVESLIAKIKI